MKLTRVEPTTQMFPDGSTSDGLVALVFEDEGEVVIKRVQISGCAKAVAQGPLTTEATRMVLKAAREAVRDFAYKKHGPDEWKKHVVWGQFFSGEMTDEEAELVKKAVELLRAA